MTNTESVAQSFSDRLLTGRNLLKALLIIPFLLVWSLPAIGLLVNPSVYGAGYLTGFSLALYVIYRATLRIGRWSLSQLGWLQDEE